MTGSQSEYQLFRCPACRRVWWGLWTLVELHRNVHTNDATDLCGAVCFGKAELWDDPAAVATAVMGGLVAAQAMAQDRSRQVDLWICERGHVTTAEGRALLKMTPVSGCHQLLPAGGRSLRCEASITAVDDPALLSVFRVGGAEAVSEVLRARRQ